MYIRHNNSVPGCPLMTTNMEHHMPDEHPLIYIFISMEVAVAVLLILSPDKGFMLLRKLNNVVRQTKGVQEKNDLVDLTLFIV